MYGADEDANREDRAVERPGARPRLKQLGVELKIVGTPLRAGPVLLVTNHISWVVIVALQLGDISALRHFEDVPGRSYGVMAPRAANLAMCWSSMMGYCLRTADAASFPSCTSCFGVYFFFGSLITVCGRQARCKFLQDGAEIYQSPHSDRSATLGSTAAARRAGR